MCEALSARTNLTNTHGGPDCWFGETDPSKRKKIQNRLAQRARRRRLADSKAKSSNSTEPLPPVPGVDKTFLSTALVRIIPQTKPHQVFVGEVPTSVFEAMFQNGVTILGRKCATCMPSRSDLPPKPVPDFLQPTTLQMTTVHYPWIDLFPFPQMRDNMILLSDILDGEDFISDLFSTDSFTIKAGFATWDPKAWMISAEFSRKWGYLFY